MKKLIAILLAALTCAAVFAGCEGGKDESSLPEETSEVSQAENQKIAKINACLGEEVDSKLNAINLFEDMDYTIATPTSDTYPNGNNKLTDGATREVFDKQSFVGWGNGSSAIITFDMGTADHGISEIVVSTLRMIDYGIGTPKYVSLRVSDDDETYIEVCKLSMPIDLPDSACYDFVLSLPKTIKARYIRIQCAASDKSFIFIDEIFGYKYSEHGNIDLKCGAENGNEDYIDDFYACKLNTGDPTVVYSENEEDFNKLQNLALLDDTTIVIKQFDRLPKNHTNSGMDDARFLNDDVLGTWFHFYRGGGRHIIYDFGCNVSVSEFKTCYYDNMQTGIAAPPVTLFSVSTDGVNWTPVAAAVNEVYGSGIAEKNRFEIDEKLKEPMVARYVRMTFQTVPNNDVSCMVYVDEFAVMGKKNATGAKEAYIPEGLVYGSYPDKNVVEGCENIVFLGITNGYGVHCDENYTISEQTAKEFIAHLDENGKAEEIFNNSICISTANDLNSYSNRNDEHDWFLKEVFYDKMNCSAIENMRGIVNEELGIEGKEKIWISVAAPAVSDTFNGEKCDNIKTALECVKWQADETIKRFNEQNYQNVELVGFYWVHEAIRQGSFDEELMTGFNEYIHKLGYKSFWCPYFTAYGAWYNHKVGFDIACLQPNYMFHDAEPTRLKTTAELAKLYGMCVEIEIEDYRGAGSRQIYREYLGAGVTEGYMDSVKVYYEGGAPGAFNRSYRNEDKKYHEVYDLSNEYAHNRLDESFLEGIASDITPYVDVQVEVKAGSQITADLPSLEEVQFRIKKSPIYGELRLSLGGKLIYIAPKNFVGTEEVVLEIYDGVSERKYITVSYNTIPKE